MTTPYGGVYANIDYDKLYGPKKYHRYPMHIPVNSEGRYLIANNEEEEKAIRDKLQEQFDNSPAEQLPYFSDPEKDILISRARELNVPFNSKWSKAKLRAVVEQAEQDIDALPPEIITPKGKQEIFTAAPLPAAEDLEEDIEALRSEAKALGGKAVHLWGVPRLKQFIEENKE